MSQKVDYVNNNPVKTEIVKMSCIDIDEPVYYRYIIGIVRPENKQERRGC